MLKTKKFLYVSVFLFLVSLLLSGFFQPITASSATLPNFVLLSKYKNTVDIGEEFYIIAVTSNGQLPSWKSSDSKIASVNTYGKVTPKKAGSVTITAKIKNGEASALITVKPTKITIVQKSTSIERGETVSLLASTSNKSKVKWKSSSKSIAKVDDNGIVTGVKPGEVTITATANGSEATCIVKVKSPTLKLDKTKITLYRGQTASLLSTVSSGFAPKWKTNKKSVAIVDDKGTITAIKNGTAIITATIDGTSKTCEVVVEKPTIQLSKTELSLKKGQSASLTAKVSSGNSPVWTSSNQTLVSVDFSGKVTALEKGRAYIYATEDGTKVKCTVYVTE